MDDCRATDFYYKWCTLREIRNQVNDILNDLDYKIHLGLGELLVEIARMVVDDGADIYQMSKTYEVDVGDIEQTILYYKTKKVDDG